MLCSSSMLILILVFCLHFHFKGTVDSLVFILIQNKSRNSQQCSVFWSSDNNSLSHPCRRCRLIPAQTSTGPKSNGGMFPASAGAILVTVPSHLTSGGVLIISYHPILLCFTASPPLHIHVNQSFILSLTSESTSPSWEQCQHQDLAEQTAQELLSHWDVKSKDSTAVTIQDYKKIHTRRIITSKEWNIMEKL